MEPDLLFRALGDETRVRCVVLLYQYTELCVCELTQALQMPQPKISRHLATLKTINLVQNRRDGVWIHYRLADDLPLWVQQIIVTLTEHCLQTSIFINDRERLPPPSLRGAAPLCM